MTRYKRNPDGTRDLISFSFSSAAGANSLMQQNEERNAKAREEWAKLTPEEQEQRTAAFHEQERQWEERLKLSCTEIPEELLLRFKAEEEAEAKAKAEKTP